PAGAADGLPADAADGGAGPGARGREPRLHDDAAAGRGRPARHREPAGRRGAERDDQPTHGSGQGGPAMERVRTLIRAAVGVAVLVAAPGCVTPPKADPAAGAKPGTAATAMTGPPTPTADGQVRPA